MKPRADVRGRVADSHRIARGAFASALAFAALAAAWTVRVLIAGGSWWGPLHAFLAGTVLLAVSGASQLFTITWSSTVPPASRTVLTQRWLLIVGVGAVLLGVGFSLPGLVWLGGAATVAGLALLAWLIATAVRKSLLRRFDLSARFYLTGFAAGVLGVTLGTLMGAGAGGGSFPNLRLVHAHLNLVGLVGLTIVGTIPTLLPTTAYSRAVSGREAVVAWWIALAGTVCIASGLGLPQMVGVGIIGIAAAATLILTGILARLRTEGRRKLTFLQVATGTLWLIGWGFGQGVMVTRTGTMTHFSGWTGAVILAGVGQVLAGSLAYLVPVLKGSPFGANREILEARPLLPLLTLNAAAISTGLRLEVAAVLLGGLWAADFGFRLARVALSKAPAVPDL